MPKPREVFDSPSTFWNFITCETDNDFEGQFFDRKELPLAGSDGSVKTNHLREFISEKVAKTISSFANSNPEGGLLVLGVSRNGQVKGIGHLSDEQRQMLVDSAAALRGHSAIVRAHDCDDSTGVARKIVLIYVPSSQDCICETNDSSPKFWLRTDNKNIPGNDRMREQLRRDKGILVFESQLCCQLRIPEVDNGVFSEFQQAVFHGECSEASIESVLFNSGAVDYDDNGRAFFTNAGCLFFSHNPQRVLSHARIRLLRFEVNIEDEDRRGAPTFDKSFTGSMSQQIRDVRKFLKESAYFRNLPQRNPEGGFSDDPEYPFQAVDEAVVNALVHRDYGIPLPVECEAYLNGFKIKNPGRILQRNYDVPSHFSLRDFQLSHLPRNPKLLEWLKLMKDERGRQFVKAVSEGTKSMRREMEIAKLPAPTYTTSDTQTQVELLNNERERKALLKFTSAPSSAEFSNLFALEVYGEGGSIERGPGFPGNGRILEVLVAQLRANGWYVHTKKYSRAIVSKKGMVIKTPDRVSEIFKIFAAFSLSVRSHWEREYLCIDYAPKVRNLVRLNTLLSTFSPEDFNGFSARAILGKWRKCHIINAQEDWSMVRFDDAEDEELVASKDILPEIPAKMIQTMLDSHGLNYDLARAIKEHSLSLNTGTARTRFDKIQVIASELAKTASPLWVDEWYFEITDRPTFLRRQGDDNEPLQVRSLDEPSVEFFKSHESADIRDGITRYGSYDHEPKNIEIIPIVASEYREKMAELIARLQIGKFKYRGAERTFGVRFTFSSIVSLPSVNHSLSECQRLLKERPEWGGDPKLSRIFLVHTPEAGYSSDDENSPYYSIKRLLLEQGIPCQMIDTPTLRNPDYKDLNLALNLAAKCGVTPWVLPDEIPDADFFIGLSYTQSGRRGQERLMGYANVFNQYGRWEFYSGSTQTFSYQDRSVNFGELAKNTLLRLSDRLPESPNISFHYSAKFSREDRMSILDAVRDVRPLGTYTFVTINTHHEVRLFDSRPETDGSLSRGSYVIASPSQIFLSTTGHNPYRKALGTPHMLELTTRIAQPLGTPRHPADLRVLAIQILNLTKLNWASTDSLCGEPITTKYAGDIAYLTAAFLRQNSSFKLHPVLENTPWFI